MVTVVVNLLKKTQAAIQRLVVALTHIDDSPLLNSRLLSAIID